MKPSKPLVGALLEYYRNPNYLTWLRAEASLIGTDGCSKVSGLRVECCYEHDLAFYYGKDPRAAYRLHRSGVVDYWAEAPETTFEAANLSLRNCMRSRSPLGWFSPAAFWRWLVVDRLGAARGAWDEHRKREQS